MHHRTASELRDLLFRISVALKGLGALLEIIGGMALLMIKPTIFVRIIGTLTEDELSEDPQDFIATHLQSLAEHLSLGAQHFAGAYLLIHGVIKILLVAALLKDKIWAYPWAIVVFGAFVVYQPYRYTFTHLLGLIALSAFDVAVIWLIWLEYRAARTRRLAV